MAADVEAPTVPEMRAPANVADDDTTLSPLSSITEGDVTVTAVPVTRVFPDTVTEPAEVILPPTLTGPAAERVPPTAVLPVTTVPRVAVKVPVNVVAVVLTYHSRLRMIPTSSKGEGQGCGEEGRRGGRQ